MNAVKNRLIDEFSDAEYAHAYMASHTISTLAAQVYWTRKARGLTQAELAQSCGMAQERISKIEAGDFSSLTMTTLNKLARALDVNLRIEFGSFSHGIYSVVHQTKDKLALPDRMSSLQQMRQEDVVLPDFLGGGPITVTTGANYNTNTQPNRLTTTGRVAIKAPVATLVVDPRLESV